MLTVYESSSAAGKELNVTGYGRLFHIKYHAGGAGSPFEHALTFDSEFESGNLLPGST